MTTLTAARRAELDDVVVPIEGGIPVGTCVVSVPGGWSVAWSHDGGRRKQAFGRAYENALEASAASAYLSERIFGPAVR